MTQQIHGTVADGFEAVREEFAAFVALNSSAIGVLSSVIQRIDDAGFVSATAYASSFDGLSSIASDIDPNALEAALGDAGLSGLGRFTYPPNGKSLIRQDFRSAGSAR